MTVRFCPLVLGSILKPFYTIVISLPILEDAYVSIGKKLLEISNALDYDIGIQSLKSFSKPISGSIAGIPSSLTIQSPALPPTVTPTVLPDGPNFVPGGNLTSLIIS
tara:strand:- start:127 stop:447 length:321 start_codon:yes stop_codon:yes gene_type:complete